MFVYYKHYLYICVRIKSKGSLKYRLTKKVTKMDDLIERVWEYSLNNPDGFTLNIENFKVVKYGLIVAFKDTQNSFGKQSLQKVINHSL